MNLTSDHDMKLIGIEDQALYDQNLKTYQTLMKKREDAMQYLRQIKLSLDRIKSKAYPQVLLDYESHYESGQRDNFQGSQESRFPKKINALLKLANTYQISTDSFYNGPTNLDQNLTLG